jgi:hypothetical protein
MDLEMPVMDGLACVRRIREMQAEGTMSRVPVIAVTANARSDQISGAMEAGMVSFVILRAFCVLLLDVFWLDWYGTGLIGNAGCCCYETVSYSGIDPKDSCGG